MQGWRQWRWIPVVDSKSPVAFEAQNIRGVEESGVVMLTQQQVEDRVVSIFKRLSEISKIEKSLSEESRKLFLELDELKKCCTHVHVDGSEAMDGSEYFTCGICGAIS